MNRDKGANRISIIIPVLNEREMLGRSLRSLQGKGVGDIIVVDGGSSDGTAAIAEEYGARLVTSSPGRAGQMNAGAGTAKGEILLFLHVDTNLPVDFAARVAAAMSVAGTAGGAFSFAVDGEGSFYRLIEKTANFRSRNMGVVFGDQAIFCGRKAFREAGGYPDQPIMEDCELVGRLKRRGRFTILPEKAMTSSRCWEETGPWRNTMVNVLITWAYRFGVDAGTLKRWHRRALSRKTPAEGAGGPA